jgi:hypothetical protein
VGDEGLQVPDVWVASARAWCVPSCKTLALASSWEFSFHQTIFRHKHFTAVWISSPLSDKANTSGTEMKQALCFTPLVRQTCRRGSYDTWPTRRRDRPLAMPREAVEVIPALGGGDHKFRRDAHSLSPKPGRPLPVAAWMLWRAIRAAKLSLAVAKCHRTPTASCSVGISNVRPSSESGAFHGDASVLPGVAPLTASAGQLVRDRTGKTARSGGQVSTRPSCLHLSRPWPAIIALCNPAAASHRRGRSMSTSSPSQSCRCESRSGATRDAAAKRGVAITTGRRSPTSVSRASRDGGRRRSC